MIELLKQYTMEGLLKKYIIQKADGTPVNPKAKYFVLRYDENMKDKKFLNASRKALSKFITEMQEVNPLLSRDLHNDLFNDKIEMEY